jgi:hypothetical protein
VLGVIGVGVMGAITAILAHCFMADPDAHGTTEVDERMGRIKAQSDSHHPAAPTVLCD